MSVLSNVEQRLVETLKEEFESIVPGDVDLEKFDDGSYKNKRTRHLWEGFKLFLFRGFKKEKALRNQDFLVVGKTDSNVQNPFSARPVRHYRLSWAVEEMERLASTHLGTTFSIFKPVVSRRVSRMIKEPVFGIARMWPRHSSIPYYVFRGHRVGNAPQESLFLTDDFGDAVSPGHIAKFDYSS